MVTVYVTRSDAETDPALAAYAVGRQLLAEKLASERGLKLDRRVDSDGLVEVAVSGGTEEVVAFLRDLASFGVGGLTVDVDDASEAAVSSALEEINETLRFVVVPW